MQLAESRGVRHTTSCHADCRACVFWHNGKTCKSKLMDPKTVRWNRKSTEINKRIIHMIIGNTYRKLAEVLQRPTSHQTCNLFGSLLADNCLVGHHALMNSISACKHAQMKKWPQGRLPKARGGRSLDSTSISHGSVIAVHHLTSTAGLSSWPLANSAGPWRIRRQLAGFPSRRVEDARSEEHLLAHRACRPACLGHMAHDA